MPRKPSSSSPKKGMIRDKAGFDLANVEYSFALNTNFQSGHGTGQVNLQKEPSNIYCSGFKDGYKVIGHKYHINADRTYFFLTNPDTGYSEIGYINSFYSYEGLDQVEKECGCDIKVILETPLEDVTQEATCTYITLISDECNRGEEGKCLNFSMDYPIHESNIQIKDEASNLSIYFTDNYNPPRYIRLDDIDRYYQIEEPCEEPEAACLQCDKMNIFMEYEPFCLTVEKLAFGGNLRAGNIQVTAAYSDSLGNELSEYYSLTNRVPIHDKDNNVLDQTNLDYVTNQSIKIGVSGLDTRYQYYKIVVIYRSGLDQTEAYYEYGIYPTSTNSVGISDLTDKSKISAYRINQVKPFFKKAKGMAQGNGHLFQYGLTSKRVQNFQKVVNLMGASIKWQTVVAEEDLYEKGDYVANYIGYMRDEVAPLSIRFISSGGYKSPLMPFIARPPKEFEIAEISNTDDERSILENAPKCSGNNRNKHWQFHNTGTLEGECVNIGFGETVIEKTETDSCIVTGEESEEPLVVDSLGTKEPYTFPGTVGNDVVGYINSNNDFIIQGNLPEWADVIDIIGSPENYPQSCIPEFPENCGEPELVSEEVFAISVGSVNTITISADVMTYQRPSSPDSCNQYAIPTDPGETHIEDTVFRDTYLNSGYTVYERATSGNNTSCQTAGSLPTYVGSPSNASQVDYAFHHQYMGTLGNISNLQGTKTSSETDATDVFTNKVHTNALWFKAEFGGADKIVVEITNTTITQTDDVCQQKMRATFFDGCASTSDISAHTTIIQNMSTTNDPDKVFLLDIADFPGGVAYIALDTPMKEVTVGEGAVAYHLTTVCGCPNIYVREYQENTVTQVTDLLFGKKSTYKATCSYAQTLVEGCDPLPKQYGLFSYWESVRTYPCNPELYNSKDLNIEVGDIPEPFKTEFEEYYVDSISGGKYVLNDEADFQDKPIRHYKFPDSKVIPFMSERGSGVGPFDKSQIYPIGFRLDNEVINALLDVAVKNDLLTQEERASITKYEIFRGDRATDMSIVAKGLLFDMYRYPSEGGGEPVQYSNYPLNALGNDQLNGGLLHPGGNSSNNAFTFHSPDTHWYKPTLRRELSIEGYQFGGAVNEFDIVEGHPIYTVLGQRAYSVASGIAAAEVTMEVIQKAADWTVLGATGGLSFAIGLTFAATSAFVDAIQAAIRQGRYRYEWINTFRGLGTPEQFAYYGVSVGHYSNFLPNKVSNSTLRGIPAITYLKEGRWEVANEVNGDVYPVNNSRREDSVYINLGDYDINYPTEYSSYDVAGATSSSRSRYQGEGRSPKMYKRAASPYASIKQFLPEQYGDINDVKWLHTGYCSDLSVDNTCTPVFGGDTTISRFSIKRKLPFFTTDAVGMAPQTPFRYSDYFNIYPNLTTNRFFLNYLMTQDDGPTFLGKVYPTLGSEYMLMDYLTGHNELYIKPPSKFYLYYYGIPHFLTESVINCNFRYAKREAHENFYPNVGDVIDWTQEQNVPISTPNTVFFNPTYHSKPFTYRYETLPITYSRKLYDKLQTMDNSVVYSRRDVDESSIEDPWLEYRPYDAFVFDKDFGTLIDIDTIESEKLLARLTNGMSFVVPQDTMAGKETEATAIFGTSGIQTGGPMNFNRTDLGYAGTQHTEKVSCEFGHFWADAKRGRVFQLQPNAQGLKDITEGVSEWFKENLPMKMPNYISGMTQSSLDNTFKGLGITMGWDERLKRVFLTKKDYIPLVDMNFSDGVFYTGSKDCPEGYTFDEDTKTCSIYTTSVPKEPNGTRLELDVSGKEPHGYSPPAIYSEYNSDGTANVDAGSATGYTYETVKDNWWIGYGVLADRYTTALGKWSTSFSDNVWYGGGSLINVSQTKTYYVALAADNRFRFSVNGTVILESDTPSMEAQHNIPLGRIAFAKIHIYPIELEAGCNVINVEGLNFGGEGLFAGAVFDNTYSEILNSTSKSELNIILSTEDVDSLYETGFTYDCPEGSTPLGESECAECAIAEGIPTDYEEFDLHDPTKFRECSFTIAYSPLLESWTSYFSFKPNYYTEYNNYFQTGINYSSDDNEVGLWSHYPLESSYNVFYGKLYPWIIEFPIVSEGYNSTLEEVSYFMNIRKYYNKHDYADIFGKGFTKAYIYNDQNNSGLINLEPQQKNNRRQKLLYPKHNSDSTTVLFTESHGEHTFNTFYNRIKNEESGLPVWKNDCSQIFKEIDGRLMDYSSRRQDRLRGDYFLVRLIEDQDSRNKYIFRAEKDKRNIHAD